MIDLLADGRSWDLLSDNAAQCQKRPLAIGFGKRFPKLSQGYSLILLQRARGGTGQGLVCRMVILRVEPVPGERGSNPPISGAPGLQLWRLAPRIDNAERQVRSVCVFCNFQKGPNIAGYDPESRKLTRLFNPRRQRWRAHFRWEGPTLVGKTAVGRTTLDVLAMNHPDRVELRRLLIEAGLLPP
jgi:hypothetical protein